MKYDIIVSDPCWFYNQRPAHFNDGTQQSKTKFGGGAPGQYDLMRDEDLLRTAPLINSIAADDCVMFMWATWPRLDFAIKYLEACGFEYKTCAFNWVKTTKSGTPAFGPGYWTSSNTEPCLLGVKRAKKSGKFSLAPQKKMLQQISETTEHLDENSDEDFFVGVFDGLEIKTPRYKHSQKPEDVQDKIDLMYPNQRKLELFARRTRPGWTATGNQNDTNCMDIFEFLHKEIAENEGNG